MHFAIDTGGTFTDLLVETPDGALAIYKASTTPDDPIEGVLASLSLAAAAHGLTLCKLLEQGELLIHGTTHAINAILTGDTARTALLVTRGHPDILVFREGGRSDVFDFSVPYPEPYVPKRLTFEVTERVIGFIVDRVHEVLRISSAIVEPPPSMITSVKSDYITGVGKLEDRLLILLDLERLFTNELLHAADRLVEQTAA